MFFQWFLLFFSVGAISHSASSLSAASCDSWVKPKASSKGVVVVTHGMNLKPKCMDEMAEALAADGYEVLRPAFAGHCGEDNNYLYVTAEQWEGDARRIHGLASALAKELDKPLHLVAYSFSALVFQTMSKELPFDRKVLLAPALSTKFWYTPVKWLASLFPSLTYESNIATECAANRVSGARPIIALDQFLQKWNRGDGKGDQTPILAFAEPDDELVSYGGLQTIVADKNNWNLERVSNAGSTMPNSYHHLIVDSASVGAEEWKRMTGMILEFLGKK